MSDDINRLTAEEFLQSLDEMAKCAAFSSDVFCDIGEDGALLFRALTAERDALLAERGRLRFCVGFFASVIKSGETWTETCEKAKDDALNAR